MSLFFLSLLSKKKKKKKKKIRAMRACMLAARFPFTMINRQETIFFFFVLIDFRLRFSILNKTKVSCFQNYYVCVCVCVYRKVCKNIFQASVLFYDFFFFFCLKLESKTYSILDLTLKLFHFKRLN